MSDQSVLMNIPSAADQLQISERTLRRLIAAGELPIVRVGRQIRIRTEDLERYIKSNVEWGVHDH